MLSIVFYANWLAKGAIASCHSHYLLYPELEWGEPPPHSSSLRGGAGPLCGLQSHAAVAGHILVLTDNVCIKAFISHIHHMIKKKRLAAKL